MGEPTALTGPDLSAGIDGSSLVEGKPLLGHAGGEAVMLVKVGGRVSAVGATCTHYSGPLAEGLVVGETIRCPWHHACFNLRTGVVERAPALNPIACYQVDAVGGKIRVGAKLEAPQPKGGPVPGVESVVIVGAGAAGHSAAEALRREGFTGAITLLGRDADAPYDRPNLSKDYLAGTAPEEWMPLRSRQAYADNGITLETGVEVSELDVKGRTVRAADGRSFRYDRLLLATGAEPVRLPVPGADAPFVHLLRTMADCRALIAAAGAAKRVVLVGSGFIGLEAAAALRTRGLEVAVVSPDAEPLVRVLGPEVGAFLRGLHQEHGVTFHMGDGVKAIEPGTVVTSSGRRLPADLVLVGIGVKPALGLAERAGLAVDGGILVDEHLQTSVPGVFAAGDVARFPDPRSGQKIRVEHWVVAQRMGAAAAANMLGAGRPFTDVPFFWSAHYDVTLSYVGHVEGPFQTTVTGSVKDRDCRVEYTQSGRRSAVLTIGRDGDSLAAERDLEGVAAPG